jgi:hypothetical protein
VPSPAAKTPTPAPSSFTDLDRNRVQVFITDQTDTDIAYPEALQRGRGRAEKLICDLKGRGWVLPGGSDVRHARVDVRVRG